MRVFAAAIVLSLFALSCGSDGDSNGSNPSGDIARADICTQGSQTACAKLFSCPPTAYPVLGFLQMGLGDSEAACRTMIQPQICDPLQCATAQAYNGTRAGQCTTEFTKVTCQALSTAATAAFTQGQGISAILGSVPGCGQICSGSNSDAATGQ